MLPLCNATPLLASCLHFNDDLSLESISSWMEAANQMNQFLMVVQQLDERSGIEQKNDFLPFQQKKSLRNLLHVLKTDSLLEFINQSKKCCT